MSRFDYVKGPWKIVGDWAIRDSSAAENLIGQFEIFDQLPSQVSFNNAALMVTAPDMYEMLVDLHDLLIDINAHDKAKEVKALIKKIRGEL